MAIVKKLFIWILLYLVSLEILLHLGGLITIWREDIKNFNSRGDYKVICIGDSITAVGSYPVDLETILNAKQKKIHFVVLNLGRPGASFDYFLPHLPIYLDQYKPNLVISMIGLAPLAQEAVSPINKISPLRLLKKSLVLRLAQSLWLEFKDKIHPIKQIMLLHMEETPHSVTSQKDASIDSYLDAMVVTVAQFPTSENYTKLGLLYRSTYKKAKSRQCLWQAVETDPNNYMAMYYFFESYFKGSPSNYMAWHDLAEYCFSVFDFNDAVLPLFQFLKFCPDSNYDMKLWAYEYLFQCFNATHRENQLLQLYEHAVLNWPNSFWGYSHLGPYLMQKKDFAEAINAYMKEISVDPKQDYPYMDLAKYYFEVKDFSSSFKILQLAIQRIPDDHILYNLWAKELLDINEIGKAENILERFLHVSPNNPDTLKGLRLRTDRDLYDYQMLSKVYDLDHKQMLSSILKTKIERYEELRSNAYVRIFEICKDKGIPLIAVQYPMKNVEALKKELPVSKTLYFVDNESSFKNGVAKSGYFEYFEDQKFNELGHMTPKGCWLLANNISLTVINVIKTNQ